MVSCRKCVGVGVRFCVRVHSVTVLSSKRERRENVKVNHWQVSEGGLYGSYVYTGVGEHRRFQLPLIAP